MPCLATEIMVPIMVVKLRTTCTQNGSVLPKVVLTNVISILISAFLLIQNPILKSFSFLGIVTSFPLGNARKNKSLAPLHVPEN